jgi:hypothetical protein
MFLQGVSVKCRKASASDPDPLQVEFGVDTTQVGTAAGPSVVTFIFPCTLCFLWS